MGNCTQRDHRYLRDTRRVRCAHEERLSVGNACWGRTDRWPGAFKQVGRRVNFRRRSPEVHHPPTTLARPAATAQSNDSREKP